MATLTKYHPDKNANDPKAADMFKEVTFSYNILSDQDKRRQYDSAGFEAVESESQDLELDLSSLGTVNTMFAALFSKLGVTIKTTVSATVLEEALNGSASTQPLPLGQPLCKKRNSLLTSTLLHPRYAKTSACKEQEATKLYKEKVAKVIFGRGGKHID
ncbi:hypothetical protein KY285_000614 [Solanum tuberosum]|nr:hypothetical protein KY285_000614 [Solanum tuberosum]